MVVVTSCSQLTLAAGSKRDVHLVSTISAPRKGFSRTLCSGLPLSTISAPRKGFRTLCSGLPLVSLPKRFLQVGLDPLSCQKTLLYTSSRPRRRQIYAAAGNQPWDFARFVKTLYFFDAIPSPLKFIESLIGKLSGQSSTEPAKKMESSGMVLVAGATGGVGRRVVNILRNKGLPVRALVRNEEKARQVLGPDVDLGESNPILPVPFAEIKHPTKRFSQAMKPGLYILPRLTHVGHDTPHIGRGIILDPYPKSKAAVARKVVADITKENTLLSEYFKGVRRVINTVSAIVGPKEGDTPDRQKYSQGIKFFEPEIKGDPPELVEYVGMRNLINAIKDSVGLRDGKLLFGLEGDSFKDLPWGALDDVVMGGVSQSTFIIDPKGGENGGPTGIFKGNVSTANNGGFASVRTKNFAGPEDLSAYDGLELRLKGDGRRYKLIVRTSTDWDTIGYTGSFDTVEGQWQSIRLPFSSLRPVFRARTVTNAPPFEPQNITSLQLMFSKFEYDGKLNPTFVEGPFELPLSSVRAYMQEPIKPRFVHVSSAGVTRPDRPGLDLSKQPPAVRLNKELGYILTYKLKGEDLLRESGIPYTIVRPCALTEEPAGADLIFDQGDNITGKISREEVARICVAALDSPHACDKTFEVKSVIPFSEPFTVDPANPPPEKDYEEYFKTLKKGITGKESLEQTPVAA